VSSKSQWFLDFEMRVFKAVIAIVCLVVGGYVASAGLDSSVIAVNAFPAEPSIRGVEPTKYQLNGHTFQDQESLNKFLRDKGYGRWYPWLFTRDPRVFTVHRELAQLLAGMAFGFAGALLRIVYDLLVRRRNLSVSSLFSGPRTGCVAGAILIGLFLIIPETYVDGWPQGLQAIFILIVLSLVAGFFSSELYLLVKKWLNAVFVFFLDPKPSASGATKPLPFGDKDGYGVFTALAGFALAQATALTVVAREEEHKTLVLLVYFVSVVGTLAWIVAMLRAKRDVVKGGSAAEERAYDQPSIRFGRWVLVWNCLLAIVLIYLGWNDLLPNQTPRVPFQTAAIPCDTLFYKDYLETLTPAQKDMDEWLGIIAQNADQKQGVGEVFFVIKQQTQFEKSFKPFSLAIRNENELFFLRSLTAFLVSPSASGSGLSYRQVPFENPRKDKIFVDSMRINDAAKGEYLIVFLFARPDTAKVDNLKPPTKKNLNVTLKKP
jgi:hypothetical protein